MQIDLKFDELWKNALIERINQYLAVQDESFFDFGLTLSYHKSKMSDTYFFQFRPAHKRTEKDSDHNADNVVSALHHFFSGYEAMMSTRSEEGVICSFMKQIGLLSDSEEGPKINFETYRVDRHNLDIGDTLYAYYDRVNIFQVKEIDLIAHRLTKTYEVVYYCTADDGEIVVFTSNEVSLGLTRHTIFIDKMTLVTYLQSEYKKYLENYHHNIAVINRLKTDI